MAIEMTKTITDPVTSNAEKANSLVEVKALTRRFGDFTAVDDIAFEVNSGEIFGFLGPNGAGKSTTIKMICTLLTPTKGTITVAGHDVVAEPDAVRSAIGIVFQDNSLDSGLTAQENLDFHCMIYHIPRTERASRINVVLKLMDLTEVRHRIVKTFSGGMRRRLEIARGLLHEPRLLILDEPTVGLDPQTRNYIWQYVRQLRERHGTAIFMTTHYMDEAENCDRIAIIDKGKIVARGTPTELKKLVGEDRVQLRTPNNARIERLLREKYQLQPSVLDGNITFEVAHSERFVPRLVAELAQQEQIVVDTLNIQRPTLEDVFLKLTGRSIRDEEGDKDQRRLLQKERGRI